MPDLERELQQVKDDMLYQVELEGHDPAIIIGMLLIVELRRLVDAVEHIPGAMP